MGKIGATALLLGGLGCSIAYAASPDWVSVAHDRLRTVELDRASVITADGGSRVAWGRILLSDSQAERAGYKSVRVLNRYDCANRAFTLVKRVYYSPEDQVLREEDLSAQPATPVRPGTADERFFMHVCPQEQKAQASSSAATPVRNLRALALEAGRRAAATSSAAPVQPVADEVPPANGTRNLQALPPPVYLPRPPTPARPRAASSASSAAVQLPPLPPPAQWGYQGPGGPDNWARLSPENQACAAGQRQSPIDIRNGIKVDQDPIQFDYKSSHFRIMDNGYTIRVSYGAGSRITVMGREYELDQIQFHMPSEELVDGRRFDMSAQLIHRDLQGRLVVVAVLLERGEPNALIQTLWNNLPLEKQDDYAATTAIQIADLLPTSPGYYAYMGSLTTPPCTEDVLWLVMKQPVGISAEQLGVFSRFYNNNARPAQPINSRVIKESR
ncbi:MAG: carbonic anhydrase [Candidatus Dactylopiibacterium carminicum]|nr:MAG: carbonic anhydrase [Candidatus Dactylopiibacterium carminicum]